MANITNTAFQDVKFNECKMLGLKFETCKNFGLSFTFNHCSLNHSSFFKLELRKTIFNHCLLFETDFSEANLTESIFNACDLNNALFYHSTLIKSDFRTAFNFAIDPEKNKLNKAKFSLDGLSGLLLKYNIDIEP
jgi:uncharacterized protein YjbI with pentapeptide repeats